jgi:DNA polymerase III sliding clamp (beta) subunit (PCNA family)
MKIRVKIGDLVEQVTQTAITTDKKAPDLPAGKVYLRALIQPAKDDTEAAKNFLVLFSSNQGISKTLFKMEIEEVLEEGQVLIEPARLLGGLLGRDNSQIAELETLPDESKVRVKVGKNVMNLPFDASTDFAVSTIKAMPRGEAVAKISAQTLLTFIKRSWFCIQADDNGQQKYALGVLNITGKDGFYTAQATDGNIVVQHVAAQTETTKYDLESLMIPREVLLDSLQKILLRHKDADVDLLEGPRNDKGVLQEIFFRMEGVQFGTALRVGVYPDIKAVLKQHDPDFQTAVSRADLKNALTRANNFVSKDDDKHTIKLSFTSDQVLNVEASNEVSDLHDELAIVETIDTIENVSLHLNIDYLTNIAGSEASETVMLGFNTDKTKALIVDHNVEGFTTRYAAMPVLLEKKTKAKKGKASE